MKTHRNRPVYFYARFDEEWTIVEQCDRLRSKLGETARLVCEEIKTLLSSGYREDTPCMRIYDLHQGRTAEGTHEDPLLLTLLQLKVFNMLRGHFLGNRVLNPMGTQSN